MQNSFTITDLMSLEDKYLVKLDGRHIKKFNCAVSLKINSTVIANVLFILNLKNIIQTKIMKILI